MSPCAVDGFLIEDASARHSLLDIEREDAPLKKSAGGDHNASLHGTARNTTMTTVFLVLAEAMGTGVFSLPGAAADLGWILSGAALVLFALAGCFSSVLLAEVKSAHPEVGSYADAARALGGWRLSAFTRGCIVLSWAFELVYYLIVTADTVALLVASHPGVLDHAWQRTLVAAALIVVPAQCRDFYAASFLTLPSVIAVVAAVVLVLADAATNTGRAFGAATSAVPAAGGSFVSKFRALANFLQAYQSQSSFLEIGREMREPVGLARVSVLANGIMLGFYAVAVVVAYGYQGADAAAFLPAGMAAGPLRTAAAALLLFHIVMVYVMSAQPFTRFLHATLFPRTLDRRTCGGVAHWALLSLAYLGIGYAVAVAVPFFADVQALCGALFAAPVIFGWPALFFFLRCRRARGDATAAGTWQEMGTRRALLCGFFFFVCAPLFMVLGVVATAGDMAAAIARSKSP